MRRACMVSLIASLLAGGAGLSLQAAALSELKVLYVGDAKAARAEEFRSFLAAKVERAEVANRATFDPVRAAGFDVVLLDWLQAENQGDFPPKKSPLGTRDSWTTPMVLLGSAGLHLATLWDVKGGSG